MTALDLVRLAAIVDGQPYPLAFATVSGAHLYGFPSRDSDVDLRGVHVLPAAEVLGLRPTRDTVDQTWREDGEEIDLVTHDLAKFARLLLGRNGYVLEQLLSPIVVATSDVHKEMVALAPGCITRHHAHHYRGFARTQWGQYGKTGELKPLLYTYRVLLTGLHLMRSGEVVADLPALLVDHPSLAYVTELIEAKVAAEHGAAPAVGERAAADVERLHAELDAAEESSQLPERSSADAALSDLVVRVRLAVRR